MSDLRIHTSDGPVQIIASPKGLSLAQAVYLAGVWPVLPLCAGLGRCGLCRVRFLADAPGATPAETRRLGLQALDQGWRLACQHPAGPGDIFVPDPPRALARLRSADHKEFCGTLPSPGQPLALAIDLGTTSIHWSAGVVDEAGFTPQFSGQGLNPQIGLGSEIMSRLAAARAGLGPELRYMVLDHVRALVADLPGPVERLALAGNPAMTALIQGGDVDGLALAPYHLDDAAGEERLLAPDLPLAFLAPLLSPFVGGDLSAGLAALRFLPKYDLAYPFILADMGTNGEFVLGLDPEHFLLASVPMGPALEGVGLSQGQVAGPGVAVGFQVGPKGLAPQWFERPPLPDETPAVSGTGYLSLLALLLGLGLLDHKGGWAEPVSPLGKGLARYVDRLGEKALDLGAGLVLPPSDVEETLKVKAAFNLALSRLLAEAGLKPRDLARFYLAGAMGQHVRPADLEALGFLPPGLGATVRAAGNTSLAGAELFLTSAQARDWARALPGRSRLVDVTSWPDFEREYFKRMEFVYVSSSPL